MKRNVVWLLVVLLAIAAVGGVLTKQAMDEKAASIRSTMLSQGKLAALGVDVTKVLSLSGSLADVGTTDYEELKVDMMEIRNATPQARFAYILGKWSNGTDFFYVDSEPASSPDISPPGQAYFEAGGAYDRAFDGEPVVNGPIEDRWGSWMTAMAPLYDPDTGEVVAVMAIDMNSADWGYQTAMAGFPYTLTALLVGTLITIFYLARSGKEREELRKAESRKALADSEEKHRLLIENSQDVIYTITPEGVFTYVSPSWTTLLGHPVDQVVGKPFYTFVHPDDIVPLLKRLQGRDEGKGRQTGIVYRTRHANGSWRWYTTSVVPLRDESGKLIGIQGSASDITERKLAEEALQASERALAGIIDFLPDATLVIDLEGRVVAWNHAIEKMTGVSKEEMIGKGDHAVAVPFYGAARPILLDLITEDDEELTSKYDYVTRKGDTLFAESFCPALNGGKGVRVWVTAASIFDEQGRRVGAIESIRDITEQSQAAKALRQANAKLSILNTITRHDINNQMLILQGLLELSRLESKDRNLDPYLERMSWVASNVQQQIAFTKDYQDLGIREPVWASLDRQITDAFAMLHPQGVRLEDETDGLEILADPLADKVPYNLIGNSLRHGGTVTRIRVSVERNGDSMLIVYEDDGMGIDDEDRDHLFEKGYGKGTGFGLFLIKEILSITGIGIVERGQMGRGVRFEIRVPPGAWRWDSNSGPSKK